MKTGIKECLAEAEIACETISLGLLHLDACKDTLSTLSPGPKVIDIAARLNTQYNALEKVLEPLKASIKASAMSSEEVTVRGVKYQADVKRIVKLILDIPEIKEFLGRNLRKFQKERPETQVSFSIRE